MAIKKVVSPPTKWRDRFVRTITVPAGSIEPHRNNPKIHGDAQIDALNGVLDELGKIDSLKAYQSEAAGGKLVYFDGHARAGLDPDETWRVDIYDLNDDECDLALATYDPVGWLAETSKERLEQLLSGIQTQSASLVQFLANERDRVGIANGLADDFPLVDVEPDIDRAVELNKKWKVKPGDIWAIGHHRLMCGDSTNPPAVTALLDGEEPALMVTDPPYGVDYDPDWRNQATRANGEPLGATSVRAAKNDHRADWMDAWKLFPGNVVYIWHGSLSTDTVKANLEECGFSMRSQIIWVKGHFAISRGHYHWQHEPCWYAVRDGKAAAWGGARDQSTCWMINNAGAFGGVKDEEQTGHSNQKPLECMARPIRNHHGDIYEPFGGSGTTMVAAENLGRRCFMMNIDPPDCAVVLDRMKRAFENIEVRRVSGRLIKKKSSDS